MDTMRSQETYTDVHRMVHKKEPFEDFQARLKEYRQLAGLEECKDKPLVVSTEEHEFIVAGYRVVVTFDTLCNGHVIMKQRQYKIVKTLEPIDITGCELPAW